MFGLAGACLAGGGLLWLLVSPVLGAILWLGAVGGVGAAMRARWYGGYTRRIGFRYRG